MASENGVRVDSNTEKRLVNFEEPVLYSNGKKLAFGKKRYTAFIGLNKDRCMSCAFKSLSCPNRDFKMICAPLNMSWREETGAKSDDIELHQPHEELKTIDDVRSHNVVDSEIPKHTGSKYHRKIRDIKGRQCMVFNSESEAYIDAVIDVYCVLEAFDVRKPALQHGSKKMLCAGIRGKGDLLQDLIEARDAIARQIDELQNK